MPPPEDQTKEKSLRELRHLVEEIGIYPAEAYEFIQQGLHYTVRKIHSDRVEEGVCRHVSGQDLCEGLREYALMQWGLLARTVLRRWNITATSDFGAIVFSLIEIGHMQKTDDDTVEDFRNVFDFRTAFERGYRIRASL